MFQEFFAKSDLLVWPLVGLIIFVAIFAGVMAFVLFGLRDQNKINEIAALPLEPDTEGHAEGRAN